MGARWPSTHQGEGPQRERALPTCCPGLRASRTEDTVLRFKLPGLCCCYGDWMPVTGALGGQQVPPSSWAVGGPALISAGACADWTCPVGRSLRQRREGGRQSSGCPLAGHGNGGGAGGRAQLEAALDGRCGEDPIPCVLCVLLWPGAGGRGLGRASPGHLGSSPLWSLPTVAGVPGILFQPFCYQMPPEY